MDNTRWFNVHQLWSPKYGAARNFDFSSDTVDHEGESTWDFWQGLQYENGQSVVFGSDTATWSRHRASNGEEIETPLYWQPKKPEIDGPKMFHFYPLSTILPADERLAAWRMRNNHVCLVRVEDVYGIAFTEYQEDIYWEDRHWQVAYGSICAGFLPWVGLPIGGDDPKLTWEHGVAVLGTAKARLVRAALRYALSRERRELEMRLRTVKDWK